MEKHNQITNHIHETTKNFANNATRLLSASVYENSILRESLLDNLEDSYHSVAESFGIDVQVILNHAVNADNKNRSFELLILVPSLAYIFSLYLLLISNDNNSTYYIIIFITYIVNCIIIYNHTSKSLKFIKNNFSLNSNNASEISNNLDFESVNNYISKIGKNVVYYSGYSPFIGSGYNIGGWSFVVDISKGKKMFNVEQEPINFNETQFYDYLNDRINDFKVTNLKIKDKIFMNGRNIRNKKYFLPEILGYPTSNISEEIIKNMMTGNFRSSRYYKLIQISDWGGDLVVTGYFRVQKEGNSFFVENNYFVLPPIDNKYKNIDIQKDKPSNDNFFEDITTTLFLPIIKPFTIAFTFFYKIIKSFNNAINDGKIQKYIQESPDFDYGSVSSIRESVSQSKYNHHFQRLDKERIVKIIEKTIFNTLADFLDSKNIDTSDFKERETSILNQGVIVTGGKMTGENISVGNNAKIQTETK